MRSCWNSSKVSTIFPQQLSAVSSSAWRWPAKRPPAFENPKPEQLPTCCFRSTANGTTLILVTHDPQLAARCDRRLRLVNGILQEEA
jgi:hypothetical protein